MGFGTTRSCALFKVSEIVGVFGGSLCFMVGVLGFVHGPRLFGSCLMVAGGRGLAVHSDWIAVSPGGWSW